MNNVFFSNLKGHFWIVNDIKPSFIDNVFMPFGMAYKSIAMKVFENNVLAVQCGYITLVINLIISPSHICQVNSPIMKCYFEGSFVSYNFCESLGDNLINL